MRLIVAATLFAFVLGSSASGAMEIVTRCPPAHPDEPGALFFDVQLYHFGDYQVGGGLETTVSIADRRRRYMVTEMEREDFRNAALRCEYLADRSLQDRKPVIPIRGLLLRCESLEGRDVTGSGPWQLLRFWCTSRIETPAP
ncbi:MAG: hypothetical protein NBV67_12250 [Tagaea sp.]|nr:hypothetical protein [Tagaea sp.]